jgi:hypothetical protein
MTEFKGLALVIAMAVAAGIAVPAAVLPVAGPSGAVRAVFLSAPDPSALPEGVSIDIWGRSAVLGGVDARAARALYAMGAVMVYPVRVHGCVALRQRTHAAAT